MAQIQAIRNTLQQVYTYVPDGAVFIILKTQHLRGRTIVPVIKIKEISAFEGVIQIEVIADRGS